MPRQGFKDFRVNKNLQSSSGVTKSFSKILPGAASLTLASASFESIDDKAAEGPRERSGQKLLKTAEAPAGIAEQESDSLAVFTRNQGLRRAQELIELLRNLRAVQNEATDDVIVFHHFPGLTYEIFLEVVREDDSLYRRFHAQPLLH